MKLKLLFYLFCSLFFLMLSGGYNFTKAQARLMMGATATYINISNGAFMVIDNSNPNAITRSAGAIISEGQNNRVKWNIGTTAGAYVVPWGYSNAAADYIPLSFTTAGAPAGAGSFILSTYRTGTCTNSSYLPTTPAGQFPTDYNSIPYQPGDASIRGVDRFWRIEPNGYTTKPDLSYLQFSYINSGANTEIGTNTCANSLTESMLEAQRWNSTLGAWQGNTWIKGAQSSNVVTLSGAGVDAPPAAADFFTWWTLVDKNYPLPVEFISFNASCDNANVKITWSTASEQNSSHFLVERSSDGTNFSSIASVTAAGNSSTTKNYSYTDSDALSGLSYYRLTQVDFNGDSRNTDAVAVSPCGEDNVFVWGNDGVIYTSINTPEDRQYIIEIYDLLGQKLYAEPVSAVKGNNRFQHEPSELASGIYLVQVVSSVNKATEKVFVRSNY